jgi:transcriptional regulator with XRE-family HTH domain
MAASFRRSKSRRRADARQIFGRNLRRACAARGIDAEKLAVLTGRSRRSVERMLSGGSDPTLSLIWLVARSIRVPLTELVRGL